jgi:hypothetical protein
MQFLCFFFYNMAVTLSINIYYQVMLYGHTEGIYHEIEVNIF